MITENDYETIFPITSLNSKLSDESVENGIHHKMTTIRIRKMGRKVKGMEFAHWSYEPQDLGSFS